MANPKVFWVEQDLVACVGHLLERIQSLELRVSELIVATSGVYRGAQHEIRYMGQRVRLTLVDFTWTGAAGILRAYGNDGNSYEAYIATMNHWPNDVAWQRVNRQPWRV